MLFMIVERYRNGDPAPVITSQEAADAVGRRP
jgi:hypothetical protein